ncbi:MAG: hypothetical protein ACYTAN_04825 [Planctomycetota bacterium]|jgi:hypothetical protein
MPTRRVCAFLIETAVAALIIFCGCRPPTETVVEPMDPVFLVDTPAREGVTCYVAFARYNVLEQRTVEEAWAAAEAVAEETDGFWRANGLRISSASGEQAASVRAALKRAGTIRAAERQVVLPSNPSFDVLIGRRLAEGGIVYESGVTRAYRDVVNLQLALEVLVLGRGAEARVSITPFFTEGAKGGISDTMLEDLRVAFPVEEGRIILVGPVENPREMRLGGLLFDEGDGGGEVRLAIIEPRRER